jgi:hypothetical protein
MMSFRPSDGSVQSSERADHAWVSEGGADRRLPWDPPSAAPDGARRYGHVIAAAHPALGRRSLGEPGQAPL